VRHWKTVRWNRAAPSLCFKARLSADLLIWKGFFYSHANKKTERKKESERFWDLEMAYYFSIQVRFMARIWLFLQKHICIHLTSTVPSITSETNFAGTKIGTKGIGTVAIDDVTDGWRCAFIGIWNRHTNLRLIAHTVPLRRHENQGHPMDLCLKISVLQAIFFWLEDLEKIICPSLEGKCSWEGQCRVSEGIWCLEQLLCAICQKPLSPPNFISLSRPLQRKGWILPYDYSQTGQ